MPLHDYTQTPLLDVHAIAESRNLMQGMFPTLVEYFFEDSACYVSEIEKAFALANAKEMVAPAHTLKSSARQMGALRLAEMAEQIEMGAREILKHQGEINTLAPTIRPLQEILASTQAAYHQHA